MHRSTLNMRIVVLNGDPYPDTSGFTAYLHVLETELHEKHDVKIFQLSSMHLANCIGCWTCWWETPGLCIHKDDAAAIFKAVINADLFLFASPLVAGFTTALLKRITDRLIVLIHPYLIIRNKESHHRKRYPNNPDFAVVLQKEADTDTEDIKIVENIYERLAINFHARMRFIHCIEDITPKQLAHVIDHS